MAGTAAKIAGAAALGLLAALARAEDFRGQSWGDSVGAVVERQGTPVDSRAGLLLYRDSIAGVSCWVGFHFHEGALAEGVYIFDDEHSDDSHYLADFRAVTRLLDTKYGRPHGDVETWRNDLYRGEPTRKGFALAAGHLVISRYWMLDRTRIDHIIGGDKFQVSHALKYRALRYMAILEKARDAENLGKL